jgi:penicillin-insensitive murein endopeptidase
MGLLSRKLGTWARFAAVASALVTLPAAASAAGSAAKPAAHAHKAAGKRAALPPRPKAERARAAVVKDAKAAVKAATKAPKASNVPASSVGAPNEGKLVGGVKLDTSSGAARVVPAYQRGDTRWGLPALIHMIERSAKKVAKKHPGAVLGVGDVSRKNGGDIFLHRSHESGRDADIAFYVVDLRGKDLKPDTFVTFQGSIESTSMPGARFDVAKNWALVQAMLEDPGARVSHIFVADPLRRLLLAYAKPRVLPALYNRAAAVMMQPSNALPHDNHFHVRISCPSEMKKSCVEYPAGVFAKATKKGKGKPALVTPRGKPGATQAVAANRPKTIARPASPARASTQKLKAQGVAAAPKPLGTAPRSAPPDRRLASDGAEKKKPIYLQSAVANDAGDPLDRVLFSVPALSHLNGAEPEGDADGADVKASVDETGTVKITD